MSIISKLDKTAEYLRNSRNAIVGRGGDISPTAGLKDFPTAIYNIPADNAITTVTAFDTDIYFTIPQGTTKYAYLAEFGGMTWSDAEQAGEFIPDGMLYDEAPESFYFGGDVDWEEVPEDEVPPDIAIPPEILALPDFRQGFNLQYYNKVDLVEQKYKRYMKTFTFDGSEGVGSIAGSAGWLTSGSAGTRYGFIKIGNIGQYAVDGVIVCDKFPTVNILGNANIGVWIYNSGAAGGVCVGFRPEGVAEMSGAGDIVSFLKSNPITVRVARTVPEVSDLPVYMNPLIYLGVLADVANEGSEAFIEGLPNDGDGYPVKIIFQTLTQ